MKKFLLAVMAVLAFSSAQATDNRYLDADGLTEKQKAELAMKLAEMREGVKAPSPAVTQTAVQVNDAAVDGVRKWGSVSTEIAKGLVVGLAAAAKEANVAVNDFAVTPVGRITTAIIVWKMIGKDIINAIISFFMLTVGTWVIWKAYRRMILVNAEYDYEPRIWGLYRKSFLKSFERSSDEPYFFTTVTFLVLEVLNWVIALHNIAPL